MITESINKKIAELFDNTPNNVGVGMGNKIKNGEYTGEVCVVFTVDKKLPLSEIPQNQVLPTSVVIDGVTYKTDVFEVGVINALTCPPNSTGGTSWATACTVCNQCYDWYPANQSSVVIPPNRSRVRPLQGGLSMATNNNINEIGTLGFFAKDASTGVLVGVTNAHVAIGDAFYTSERNLLGVVQNEMADNGLQPGAEISTPTSNDIIGQVVRYVPLYKTTTSIKNQVDAALVAVNSASIRSIQNGTPTSADSFNQIGLTGITQPMYFASTSDIDSLLTTYSGAEIWSSGRSTGPKQGLCGLKINSVNYSALVNGYNLQGVSNSAIFEQCISFTRINPNCIYPIYPGDSGSALIGYFPATPGGPNLVPKIIGLCFAASDTLGLAVRIDKLTTALDIVWWDGLQPNFILPSSIKFVTVPNGSSNKTLSCSGQTYWQVGLTNSSFYC